MGDGNCFYRSISYILLKEENFYNVIKEKISNYVLENYFESSEYGDVNDIAKRILEEGYAAKYDWM